MDTTLYALLKNKIKESAYDDTELRQKLLKVIDDVEIINGNGEGSISKTIADEITKVINGAPEKFDTLKELSDWISNHETDAAAMNSVIQENKGNIVALENNKVDKVEGMGLSTNDYTTDEKTKLAGLSNYDDSLLTGKISSLESEMSDLKSNIASVDEINNYLFGEEE